MLKTKSTFARGFTIVELLVVITVIAILSTVSVVSYRGVQKRAQQAAADTQVSQAEKRLAVFFVENGSYPESIADCPSPAAENICIGASDYMYSRHGAGFVADKIYSKYNEPGYEIASMQKSRFLYASKLESTGNKEFTQYTDLAPYFDEYGINKEYLLTFTIKAPVPGNVRVYAQNGSTTRYGISYTDIATTTQFATHTITIKPVKSNMSTPQAMLAFYGGYGSGVVPTVKDVSLTLK